MNSRWPSNYLSSKPSVHGRIRSVVVVVVVVVVVLIIYYPCHHQLPPLLIPCHFVPYSQPADWDQVREVVNTEGSLQLTVETGQPFHKVYELQLAVLAMLENKQGGWWW